MTHNKNADISDILSRDSVLKKLVDIFKC